MSENWTDEQIAEINSEMDAGALQAIHELLDSGGIPRGTFADDHVRNLVALYNQRGDRIKLLEASLSQGMIALLSSDPENPLVDIFEQVLKPTEPKVEKTS